MSIPRYRITLSDDARVTATLQRQTAPTAHALSACPRRGGRPGPRRTVAYGSVRTAERKVVALVTAAGAGSNRLMLHRLVGGRQLKPGVYRVLLTGRRADGSVSRTVAVRFRVLK